MAAPEEVAIAAKVWIERNGLELLWSPIGVAILVAILDSAAANLYGGTFTVVKVRDELRRGDFSDPGWYNAPARNVASKVSDDPDFGKPARRNPYT